MRRPYLQMGAVLLLAMVSPFSLTAAGSDEESCYQLGVRYGRCAGAAMVGKKCAPEDDIISPPRCRGDSAFGRGIEQGLKQVSELKEAKRPKGAVTLYVTASTLNVRAQPDPGSRVVRQLHRGHRLRLLLRGEVERHGITWMKVRDGYVARKFLSETPPSVRPEAVPSASVPELARRWFGGMGATTERCPDSLVQPLRSSSGYRSATCGAMAARTTGEVRAAWERTFGSSPQGFQKASEWVDTSSLAPGTTMFVKWYRRNDVNLMLIAATVPEFPRQAMFVVVESSK